MAEDQRPDEDQMIEIGDPTEEPASVGAESPPRVVIEYRDRGVPWMLIPPLLVLSAVVAVVATPALKPEPERVGAANPGPARPEVKPEAATPPPAVAVVTTTSPAPIVAAAPAPVEPAPLVLPEPAPPAFPRVQGLGFDADALRADSKPGAPVDPAIAPAGQGPAGEAPPVRAGDGPPEVVQQQQPVEVDPDVLPTDPRQALQFRLRRTAEARRRAEEDRGRFHAELAAIYRRQGDRAAPAINDLCKKYGSEIDPAVKQRAVQLLGERGPAAGASRAVRINLLRAEGFPEAAILRDIFEQEISWITDGKSLSKAVRGGPRSLDEVFCSAALMLLNNPPRKVATPATTRPASDTRDDRGSRSNPGGSPASRALGSATAPR